jgi:hypothetical protein
VSVDHSFLDCPTAGIDSVLVLGRFLHTRNLADTEEDQPCGGL